MSDRPHRLTPTFFLLALCFTAWVILFGSHQSSPSMTAQVTGQTYYVCDCGQGAAPGCVPGNDANAGTSPTTPFQTIAKADLQANKFVGGETMAFCDGGAWDMPATAPYIRLRNSKSTAQTPITFTDYPTSWGAPGGQVALPLLRMRFWLDSSSARKIGIIFRNLYLYGDDSGNGIFFNSAEDILMENLTLEHFNVGVYSQSDKTGVYPISQRVTLRNSRILNNAGQGWLGGAVDTLIEDNIFDNNGWRNNQNGYPNAEHPMFFHNIYISGNDLTTPMTGIIRRNRLTRSAPTLTDECASVSLVGHSQIADLLIEDNVFTSTTGGNGCWGIGLGMLHGGDTLRRITIRNNTFENIGNTAIDLTACEDCLVEGNLLVHRTYGTYQFRGIRTDKQVWADPTIYQQPPTKNVIRNNTFVYDMPTGKAGGAPIYAEVDGTGNSIYGNVVYNSKASDTGFNCIEVVTPDPSIITMDRNVCSPASTTWAVFNGTKRTLAQQQAAGFDIHSFFANPLFTSLTNFLPQSGSPLIDAGGSNCPSRDINGRSRPQGTACDIGAFEAGTGGGGTTSSASSSAAPLQEVCAKVTFTYGSNRPITMVGTMNGGTAGTPYAVTPDANGIACIPASSIPSFANSLLTIRIRAKGAFRGDLTLTTPLNATRAMPALITLGLGDIDGNGLTDLNDALLLIASFKGTPNADVTYALGTTPLSLKQIVEVIKALHDE